MVKRMLKVYTVVAQEFHQFFSPLLTAAAILFLHGMVSLGLFFDRLFFPSLREKNIEKPIVIVGNPRSGTTFLHRFLIEQHFGAGMRVWKMICPSLALQTIVNPFIPFLERFSPARYHTHAAHETDLTALETDDPSFLFRFFDGLFLYGFFLAWDKTGSMAYFDPQVRDTSRRDFSWLKSMWRRNLVSEQRERVVSKLFSLGMHLPRFLETFPDAKILYMLRDPLQTIPSGLSLVTGVLDGRYGFWNLQVDKRRRYIENLYAGLLELSLRFHDDYIQGRIPKEKILVVRFDRLMNDFSALMNEIVEFTETEPSPDLERRIREVAEQQKTYSSAHKYDLEKFGLDEARIKRDFASIYATFLQ
jgi:hypothetical protein